jgi:hypothetical protein
MAKSNESSRPHRERLLRHARAYIQRGFFIVPIPRGQRHPKYKDWQGFRLRLKDVKQFFSDAGGIGLLLKPSKVTDIDLDCPEALAAANLLLPATAMVHGHRSNPSSHYYYRVRPTPENKPFADPRRGHGRGRAMLVEIRGKGQTEVPPSRHLPTGELIKWESQGEPEVIDSGTLFRAVARVAAAALLGRYWPRGSRHFAAMALAGMLLRVGWTEKATVKFVRAVAAAAGDAESSSRLHDVITTCQRIREGHHATGTPTLADLIGDDIVEKVCEWLELKRESEGAPHHTDLGNARRLVAQHGKNLRFCNESGRWLVWNGKIWATDSSGMVDRLARDTVRTIYLEAGAAKDGDRGSLAKHAVKSEAEARLRAMVNLARAEPDIPVSASELDADPWVLNCRNGLVDLRTGTLRSHHPDKLCTKQVDVTFEPEAKCPIWLGFLHRVMAGNKALVKFLKRAVGYGLTGSTREQILFFLYGKGANGKSTFIETYRNLLGDYAQQAEFDTFVTKKNDGPRNDLARLRGARFVSAVEAAQGRRLAENVIKQATG